MKRSLPFIASFLGFVGGFVDSAGYLGLGGLFTSHVTGNLAVLGARLARQEMHGGGVLGVLFIPIFAAAVAAAGIIARAARRRQLDDVSALLLVEGAILAGAAVAAYLSAEPLARGDPKLIAVIGSLSVVAMGIQNGMMRESFGGQAPTTVMTGNVTQLSLDLLELARTPRANAEHRRVVTGRLRKYGAALAGFVVGAGAGASLEHFGGMGSLLVPALLLFSLSAMHLGRAQAQAT